MEGGKTPSSRSSYRSGWSSNLSLNSANACSSETRVTMATSGQVSTSFARASTSWLVAFGMNASTLTSSRTEPIMLWMWALTSSPRPKTRMQMNVVVTAVMLVSRFRRRFLRVSARKNPRLNLIGVRPLYLVADYTPRLQGDYPLAHHVYHLPVVGRDQHGCAYAVDPVQELHDTDTGCGVEVARRLVGDEDGRLRYESPGYRDALLLAAREHFGKLVHLPREAHEVEYLGHLRADGTPPLARDLHRVGDVLGCGLVREQFEVLKDAPDAPAHARDPAPRHGRQPGTVHVDGPRRGFHLLQDQAHYSRLTRAASPYQEHELT